MFAVNLVIALFAFLTLFCTALLVPVLWTALTKTVVQPPSLDQRCLTVKDDAARLTCYDRVLRKNSLRLKDKNDSAASE